MIELRTVLEQRGRVVEELEALNKKVYTEGRDFNEEEQRTWDSMKRELELLQDKLEPLQAQDQRNRAEIARIHGMAPKAGEAWLDERSGKQVQVLTRGQNFTDFQNREERELDFGKALRGALTGKWSPNSEERNFLHTGSDGGILVSETLSDKVWDLAREGSLLGQAGARFFKMDQPTARIIRLTDEPTGEVKAEGELYTKQSAMFSSLTLEAKTVGVYVELSNELVEDSIGVYNAITTAFANGIREKLDQLALYGVTANGEPSGIFNNLSVHTEAHNAVLADYRPFINGWTKVLSSKINPTSMAYNPREAGNMALLTASVDGQYLQKPQVLNNLNQIINSTLVPGDALIGDLSNIVVGVRSEFKIVTSSTAGDIFQSNMTAIRGQIRFDVGVMNPKGICLIKGLQ